MAYEVETTGEWALDYEQLPNSRMNTHSFRFFSVHPNLADTFVLSHPTRGAILKHPNGQEDLLTAIDDYPSETKAVTKPLFTRKKL